MASEPQGEVRRVPCHDRHVAAGARMVPFAGWSMPVQYTSILAEHKAVRTGCGLFDVSHMGELRVKGTRSTECLEQLVTNHVGRLSPGTALYTPMCRQSGGIVDDLIVYRLWPDEYMVVVNASNLAKDREWIENHLTRGIELRDESDDTCLFALQGPRAEKVARSLGMNVKGMPAFGTRDVELRGVRCLAARTGYTGEDGFEIFVPAAKGPEVWDALAGHQDVTLCGLGARDTLRLEARLLLYGNDMDDETTPIEAGLAWTCKLDKPISFNGREKLEEQVRDGTARKLVGLEVPGKIPARHGYPVFAGEDEVGIVTSGTFGPTVQKNVALAYVKTEHGKRGTELAVGVRGQKLPASVCRTPFYKRQGA